MNDFALDWWSVGVILFELIVGITPFNDATVEQVYDNIVHNRVPWGDIDIGLFIIMYKYYIMLNFKKKKILR